MSLGPRTARMKDSQDGEEQKVAVRDAMYLPSSGLWTQGSGRMDGSTGRTEFGIDEGGVDDDGVKQVVGKTEEDGAAGGSNMG